MNEQNRQRLGRIAARHAKRAAQESQGEERELRSENADGNTFLAEFDRARDEVLRPVMAEVGIHLKAEGYLFRIASGGEATSPSVELRVIREGRGDSKDTIRFFARKDVERGWQVIAELDLKRSPIELTRFESVDQMTHEIVEQLVVDAVEQMFSSTGGAPRRQPPPEERTAEPTLRPSPPPDADAASGDREPELGLPAALEVEEADAPALLAPLDDAPEMRWARWAGAQDIGDTTAEINVETLRRSLLPFAHAPKPPPLAQDDGHGTVILPIAWRQEVPTKSHAASPQEQDDGHETVVLENAVFEPALPFVQSGAPRNHVAEALPAWTAGPRRKRLVRFDPQTGKPLPEPIWVDVPDPGKRER